MKCLVWLREIIILNILTCVRAFFLISNTCVDPSLRETTVAIYPRDQRGFEKDRALLNTEGRKKTRRIVILCFFFFLFSFFSTGTYVLFCTEQKYKLFMKDEVTAAASLPPTPFLSTPALPPFARIHRVPFACHRTVQHLRFSSSLNLPRPASQIIPRSRIPFLTTARM